METAQQIGAALLSMALAIVAGSAPFVVKWTLAHVKARLDFDVSKEDERRLEKAVVEGIHFAEEEYAGRSEKGLIKQNAAVKHILESIKHSGLAEKTEEWAVARIQAKLGQHRHEAGGAS